MTDESLNLPRVSLDDSSINLNDDLLVANSDRSSTSVVYNNKNNIQRIRTSIDNDSIISSSVHGFNPDETREDVYSPLGPNSIYELTIGSDIARLRRNKPLKSSVTINGGVNTVYNLNTPTTRDIPQIQLSKLHMKVSDAELYEKYVKSSQKEYKQFESSYKTLTEDTLQQFQQRLSETTTIEDIDVIPKVFLDSNFRLDDPRIFKQVIQDTSLIESSTELQDKLSNYLDIVEMNLIQEIGKSSDSFFNAIGDIEKIQNKSKNCVDIYNDINKELNELQYTQSKQGLNILHKLIELENTEKFESILLQIQYITLIFDLANKSFTSGNYSKCLNEIVIVENLLHGTTYKDPQFPKLPNMVDLSALPAFIHLRNDLSSLKHECSKGYTDDFIELLLNDLRHHYRNIPLQNTLNRLYVQQDKSKKYSSQLINNSYLNIEETTKSQLLAYVKDLEKSGNISQAYLEYQHRFVTEIKDIIKQNLPQSSTEMSRSSSRNSPAPESKPNALSTNIKTLTPKEFETMFCKTFTQLSECLRRLTIHQKILLDMALTNSKTEDIMSLDITTAIHKAIELTQIRLMKVISVRSEQTADLPVTFYLRLYSITSSYLYECELINPGFAITGAGNALGDWFNNHLTYFVHRFHINSIKEMSNECTKEIWREVVDGKELGMGQVVIDELVGYVNGNDSWSKYFDFYEGEKEETKVEEVKKLKIVDDVFLIPNLALKTIVHIRDYIIISKAFPSFISTVSNNLLNYFKVLNSKTSQAVLNAGATRTAGLKHITTKHLALCIQFIEFKISLLDCIKPFFPQDTPENPEDITFARIYSNYKDHETELFSKIVTMMYDRTVQRCTNLPTINWSEPVKHPQQCHSYMEDIVKDTITVAKVLTKYLPDLKSQLILSQVFDNYKRVFIETYCTKLPPFTDFFDKQNVLKDVDYFRVKLCDVIGYGNSGQVIWENVNAMSTEEELKMELKMKQNLESERQKPANTRSFSIDRLVSSARSSFDLHRKDDVVIEPRPQSATGNLQGNEVEENEVIFDVTETSVEPEVRNSIDKEDDGEEKVEDISLETVNGQDVKEIIQDDTLSEKQVEEEHNSENDVPIAKGDVIAENEEEIPGEGQENVTRKVPESSEKVVPETNDAVETENLDEQEVKVENENETDHTEQIEEGESEAQVEEKQEDFEEEKPVETYPVDIKGHNEKEILHQESSEQIAEPEETSIENNEQKTEEQNIDVDKDGSEAIIDDDTEHTLEEDSEKVNQDENIDETVEQENNTEKGVTDVDSVKPEVVEGVSKDFIDETVPDITDSNNMAEQIQPEQEKAVEDNKDQGVEPVKTNGNIESKSKSKLKKKKSKKNKKK